MSPAVRMLVSGRLGTGQLHLTEGQVDERGEQADVLDVVRERYPEVRIWDATTATFQTLIL